MSLRISENKSAFVQKIKGKEGNFLSQRSQAHTDDEAELPPLCNVCPESARGLFQHEKPASDVSKWGTRNRNLFFLWKLFPSLTAASCVQPKSRSDKNVCHSSEYLRVSWAFILGLSRVFLSQPASHHEMIGNDETNRNELASQCCFPLEAWCSLWSPLPVTSQWRASVQRRRPSVAKSLKHLGLCTATDLLDSIFPACISTFFPFPVFYLFTYHRPSPVPEEAQVSKFLNLVPFPIPRVSYVRFWQRKPL